MTDHPPSPLDLLTPAPPGWTWCVIHTKPRCEKKVAALHALKQAEIYLPCTPRVHNYANRVRRYEVPLFTGYVFGRLPGDHVAWYRNNQHVANVIEVVDEEKLLRPLRAIAASLAAGLELEVMPPLGPGTTVLVTGGPLKGLETEVLEIADTNKVLIRLEMIQKVVGVEIEASCLRRLET